MGKKGFLVGTALANSRTRRSYQPSNYHYTPQHHYTSSYNRWYSKPRRHYYYSSSSYNGYSSYRGKRDAGHPEMVELKRMKTDLESEQLDLNEIEGSEVAETEVEFRKLEEQDDDGKNWVWTR